jgi:hypothetical protein
MWLIALAVIAAQPMPAAHPVRVRAAPRATATVRIVRFATVRMGEAATDRHDLNVRASEGRFRDADGRYRAARIVELP